ncbi:hypothetical protein PLESTB_000602000 [Pleodorina starrii]|uniref:Uncharacterized protein n=1 Tax=Pleodorina starrii TaxID=330485 RepID=A0A9W6F0L4_9CHLO|nr:hypothetical protein PLESTM_002033000 [Pleodorina starrii]GLC52258.1 hypothetical protein PLESTB_000602000 [Pleodorina starrii]GLC67561.1 hypothetical protein PLESTF_000573700 [Pleodorina starrii]
MTNRANTGHLHNAPCCDPSGCAGEQALRVLPSCRPGSSGHAAASHIGGTHVAAAAATTTMIRSAATISAVDDVAATGAAASPLPQSFPHSAAAAASRPPLPSGPLLDRGRPRASPCLHDSTRQTASSFSSSPRPMTMTASGRAVAGCPSVHKTPATHPCPSPSPCPGSSSSGDVNVDVGVNGVSGDCPMTVFITGIAESLQRAQSMGRLAPHAPAPAVSAPLRQQASLQQQEAQQQQVQQQQVQQQPVHVSPLQPQPTEVLWPLPRRQPAPAELGPPSVSASELGSASTSQQPGWVLTWATQPPQPAPSVAAVAAVAAAATKCVARQSTPPSKPLTTPPVMPPSKPLSAPPSKPLWAPPPTPPPKPLSTPPATPPPKPLSTPPMAPPLCAGSGRSLQRLPSQARLENGDKLQEGVSGELHRRDDERIWAQAGVSCWR